MFYKDKLITVIFDPSCEGMIFDSAGTALQGITGAPLPSTAKRQLTHKGVSIITAE